MINRYIAKIANKEVKHCSDDMNEYLRKYSLKWHEDESSWRAGFQDRQNQIVKSLYEFQEKMEKQAAVNNAALLKAQERIADALERIASRPQEMK